MFHTPFDALQVRDMNVRASQELHHAPEAAKAGEVERAFITHRLKPGSLVVKSSTPLFESILRYQQGLMKSARI